MKQEKALEIMKSGRNVFLTGAAGCGKTFLLNKFIEYLKKKKIGVGITASTGIAATHIGGRTIHSWCGIEIRDELSPLYLKKLLKRDYLIEQFAKTDVLIIDEVSMLHAHRLDMVDQVARMFKNPFLPFGGLQVVMSGDFFQLPPVGRIGEENSFIFSSRAWSEMDIAVCYLEEQYRQEDEALLNILNEIRQGAVSQLSRQSLRCRVGSKYKEGTRPAKLVSHRADADNINNSELGKIKEESREFIMSSDGSRGLVKELKNSCLAPESLVLKLGARVMFVKNKYIKEKSVYVNGTIGTVIDFDEMRCGLPVVETDKGEVFTVEPEDWTIDDDKGILAKVTQIPLRLAWAITVHKSQGMSLSSAEIDLRRCFCFGMGYVALSRVSSLDGIYLAGINETAFRVDPRIMEYDWELRRMSES